MCICVLGREGGDEKSVLRRACVCVIKREGGKDGYYRGEWAGLECFGVGVEEEVRLGGVCRLC